MESLFPLNPVDTFNSSAYFQILILPVSMWRTQKLTQKIKIKCYKNRLFVARAKYCQWILEANFHCQSSLWKVGIGRRPPALNRQNCVSGWTSPRGHTKTSHDLTWPGVKRVLLYCPSLWHFINVCAWPRSRNIHKLVAISFDNYKYVRVKGLNTFYKGSRGDDFITFEKLT